MVDGRALLDLCYAEDAAAQVDMNLVMTSQGEFIELQSTGEEATFDQSQLLAMIDLGRCGVEQLLRAQQTALSAG
jgi:ribonuclease PH